MRHTTSIKHKEGHQMNLNERITLLREANPNNIYDLNTETRSIHLVVRDPDSDIQLGSGGLAIAYKTICVYSESETEAY